MPKKINKKTKNTFLVAGISLLIVGAFFLSADFKKSEENSSAQLTANSLSPNGSMGGTMIPACDESNYCPWSPATSTVCAGVSFTQTLTAPSVVCCGIMTGTEGCVFSPECSAYWHCLLESWSMYSGFTRVVTGTKDCSCALPWGGTIANNTSVTAYSASSVPCGSDCSSIRQTRTCTNGVLSGTYTNQNCSVATCPYTCTGSLPLNSSMFVNDNVGLTADTPYTYWPVDTGTRCQYSCNSGYTWNGSACVASGTCSNGANNYPACNSCTTPLVWNGSACVASGTCSNGANNYPACNSCTAPLYWNGSSCVAPVGTCTISDPYPSNPEDCYWFVNGDPYCIHMRPRGSVAECTNYGGMTLAACLASCCVPNNCAASTCTTDTCNNGCATVPGTLLCDNHCELITSECAQCWNGYDWPWGTIPCVIPDVCSGNLCITPINHCELTTSICTTCWNNVAFVQGVIPCDPPNFCSDGFCVAFLCTGSTKLNSTMYVGDNLDLVANTAYTYSAENTPAKCEYTCNIGYYWFRPLWRFAVPYCKPYICTGSVPDNATMFTDDDFELTVDTPYTYWPVDTGTRCQYTCDSGFGWDGDSCEPCDCSIDSDTECAGVPYFGNCNQPCTGTRPRTCLEWGLCSASCGSGGIQQRSCSCPGGTETQACNSQPCPPGYREVAPW